MKAYLLLTASLFLTAPVFAQEMDATENTDEAVISITEDSVTVLETYNYNFGWVKKNKSESARFRLRNNGNYPFYINDIDTWGKYFSHTENCGGVLWPGQSCRATVKFAPKKVGSWSGALRFDLVGRSDINVNLSGWCYNY